MEQKMLLEHVQGKLIQIPAFVKANLIGHVVCQFSSFFKFYSMTTMNFKTILEKFIRFYQKKGRPAKVPVRREKYIRENSNPIDANLYPEIYCKQTELDVQNLRQNSNSS